MWQTFILGTFATLISKTVQDRASRQKEREAQLADEVEKASALFDSISTAANGRLYLMKKIRQWIDEGMNKEVLDGYWADYQKILYSWNAELNLNLAKVEQYFGPTMRHLIEHDDADSDDGTGIAFEFKKLSLMLNGYYRMLKVDTDDWPQLEDHLWKQLDLMNRKMMCCIQQRHVGTFHPEFRMI